MADPGGVPARPFTMKQASVSSTVHGGGKRHAVTLTVRWHHSGERGPRRGGYHAACCATGAKYSGGTPDISAGVLPADAKRRQLNFGLKDSRG